MAASLPPDISSYTPLHIISTFCFLLHLAPLLCCAVQRAVDTITGPLCQDEIELLEQALAFYGKQAGRWDIICRDHLPHRQPQVGGWGAMGG